MGEVEADFLCALKEHVRSAQQYQPHLGQGQPLRRTCELCIEAGRPAVSNGRHLWIPTAEILYLAPAMILHYVSDHGYAPPREFRTAVLECPAQGSPGFLDLIDVLYRRDQERIVERQERLNAWLLEGMCPSCGIWVYLADESQPQEHCNQALVNVKRRTAVPPR